MWAVWLLYTILMSWGNPLLTIFLAPFNSLSKTLIRYWVDLPPSSSSWWSRRCSGDDFEPNNRCPSRLSLTNPLASINSCDGSDESDCILGVEGIPWQPVRAAGSDDAVKEKGEEVGRMRRKWRKEVKRWVKKEKRRKRREEREEREEKRRKRRKRREIN